MRQKPFQLRRAEENLCGKTVLRSQKVFPGYRRRCERVVGEKRALAFVRIYDYRSTNVSPVPWLLFLGRARDTHLDDYVVSRTLGVGKVLADGQANEPPG
jgi:hypothetical protein